MTREGPGAFRLFDRLLAMSGARFLLWLVFSSILLKGALSIDPHLVTSHYDEHYFFAQDDITRTTVVSYGELPAWNPYFCGGIPAAANPQSQAFAPDFLLRILFGTGPGRRLAVLLFVLLGLEGTYRLARRYRCTELGAVAAAIAFAASGRFFFMVQFGWINMFGFLLLPWAILGYEQAVAPRGAERLPHALLGGGALAWMALCGGTYSLPFSVLAMIALALWDTLAALAFREHGRIRDPFIALTLVGVCAALLSAVKLVPMFEVVAEHPRTWTEPSIVGPMGVIESLIQRDGGTFGGESYVGGLFVVAAFIPLFFRDAHVIKPLAIGALFFALAMGNLGKQNDISIYAAVHWLPIYSQLRNPERFTVIVCLFFALAVGRLPAHLEAGPLAIARLLRARFRPAPQWNPGRVARFVTGILGGIAAAAFVVVLAVDLTRENRIAMDLFSQDAPRFLEAPFRQSRGNRWDAQVWPRASMGTLLCFDENPYPQSPALRGDLPAEERAEPAIAASVKRVAWTPNSIRLDVDAREDAMILVNQNFHRGWRASVGTPFAHDGLLAVRVPPGHHTVDFRFRSNALYAGFAITIATLVGILVVTGVRWRKVRRSKAADAK